MTFLSDPSVSGNGALAAEEIRPLGDRIRAAASRLAGFFEAASPRRAADAESGDHPWDSSPYREILNRSNIWG